MGSFQLRGPDYLIKCQTEKKTVRAYILFCWHQLINILSDHVPFFVPLHDPLPHLQDKYRSPRYHILTQHHLKTEKHKGHTIFAHFFVEKENLSRNLFFSFCSFSYSFHWPGLHHMYMLATSEAGKAWIPGMHCAIGCGGGKQDAKLVHNICLTILTF